MTTMLPNTALEPTGASVSGFSRSVRLFHGLFSRRLSFWSLGDFTPMTESRQPSKEEIKRLIDVGLDAATYIPLRKALSPHLIEPFVRVLTWPYASPLVEHPCWIIADLGFHSAGMTIAYSAHGHGGYGDPWGVVLAGDTAFGRDDSWFACLEDAFINSGAWTQPLPSEYEIR